MSEAAPVIRWNGDQLVGSDGQPITDRQRYKARRYNRDQLVTQQRSGFTPTGSLERVFRVDPLPACSLQHRVVYRVLADKEVLVCTCQRARGTTRSDPGACSHALAVWYFLHGVPGGDA